jgi:DNA polymerase III alpha subunit
MKLNQSLLFDILSDKKQAYVLDTETTGLGTKEKPARLIEYSGIKLKLEKKLTLSYSDDSSEVILNFNGDIRKFPIDTIVKPYNNESLEIIVKNNSKTIVRESLIIKYNIPLIERINNKGKRSYILPFNSFGNFIEEEVHDQMYKVDDEIEPIACAVHRIYDSNYIDKTLFFKPLNEVQNYIYQFIDYYHNSYIVKEDKAIKLSIKKIKDAIRDYKKEQKKLDNSSKEYYEYDKKLQDLSKKLLESENEKDKLTYNLSLIKTLKSSKNKNELITTFLTFLENNGFRDSKDRPYLSEEDKTKYYDILNSKDIVKFGHNLFMFDIKNILEHEIGKLNTYNFIDTIYFNMEMKSEKKRPSLNGLITNTLKENKKYYSKAIKDKNRVVTKIIKEISKEDSNLELSLIKQQEELTKLLTELLQGHYYEDFTEIESLIHSLSNYSIENRNNSDNIYSITELRQLNNINKLIEDRKYIHTSLLDIRLNTVAFQNQIKQYLTRHGFNDILVVDKYINNRASNLQLDTKFDDIEIEGYLGLQTSYSLGVTTTSSDLLKFAKDNSLSKIAISDDNMTNGIKNYSLFNKSKDVDLINAVKCNIVGYDNYPISLIFNNSKDYFNSLLLIKEYKITLDNLQLLLDKTDTIVTIHPNLDNIIKHNQVYIQVSPFYTDIDYDNITFRNSRILWVNNRYLENSSKDKALSFIWNKVSENKTINPITLNSIYYESEQYQNYHILTKEELFNYFNPKDYRDIYDNSNRVIKEASPFDIEANHIDLIPTTKTLLPELKDIPNTPLEYRELFSKLLDKAYIDKDIDSLIKIKSIKNFFIQKKREYDILSFKELDKLDKSQLDFISLLNNTEFSRYNKSELLEFISDFAKGDSKIVKEYMQFQNDTVSRYKNAIEYELDSLSAFPNYKTVFNYYLLMSKILNTLSKNGISHGPGRGSAAGSIISYLFDITEIDPIDDSLLFERFLNPERVSMPDIDTDLPLSPSITKDLVISILEEEFKFNESEIYQFFDQFDNLYDKDIVKASLPLLTFNSKIATITESSNKTVFGNFFRLLGTSFMQLNKIQREYSSDLSIVENINSIRGVDSYLNSIGFISDDLDELTGLVAGYGVHAGGVRITAGPVNAETFINAGNSTTFTKDTERNEAKMDLLGLNSQLIVDELRMSSEVSNISNREEILDYNFTVFDDSNIFKTIQNGLTAGVFQIESKSMTNILKQLSISDFDTLITTIALYRPGPIGSGDVDKYIIERAISIQEKHKKYFDKLSIDFNIGYIEFKDVEKVYNSIKDKRFKKLMTLDSFFKAINTKPYKESTEFIQKVDSKLSSIIHILEQDKSLSIEEILEIKNSAILEEKDYIRSLETIELLYFDLIKNGSHKDVMNEIYEKVAGWEDSIKLNPIYQDITKDTYGIIVYQEQIMQMATRIAGFTKGEADALRKVIAKSKKLEILQFRDELLKGFTHKLDRVIFKNNSYLTRNDNFETILVSGGNSINLFNSKFDIIDGKLDIKLTEDPLKLNKIKESINIEDLKSYEIADIEYIDSYDINTASYLFDSIVGFGSYAFNKSHAASYARLTYIMAFYKTYYPEKFYSIALKHSNTRTSQSLIREIKLYSDINIMIKPINEINGSFEYESKLIYLTPAVLKSVKDISISILEMEVKKKPLLSLIDLRLRVGTLFDKSSFKKLGIGGLLSDLHDKLTAKSYYEFSNEIHESLVLIEKTHLSDLSKYIKNDINNMHIDLFDSLESKEIRAYKNRIYKIVNNSFKNIIKLRLIDKRNKVLELELDKQYKLLESIANKDNNDEKDYKNIKITIDFLQKNIKPLSDEEKDLCYNLSIKELEENSSYYDLLLLNAVNRYYNSADIKDTIIEDVQNILSVDEERLLRFNYLIDSQVKFSDSEQDEVNLELFSNYNINIPKIDLTNRTLDKKMVETEIDTYYKDMISKLKSLELYNHEDVIINLSNPYYYIGSKPEVLVLVENRLWGDIRSITYKGEALERRELSFTPKGQTEPVVYDRFYTSTNKEFKFNRGSQLLEEVVKDERGKNSYKVVNSGDYQLEYDISIQNYIEDIFKELPTLNRENIILMSYYPFSKSKVPAKLLNEGLFFQTLKDFLYKIKPPLILTSGSGVTNSIKSMHKLKKETFETVNNEMAYHFNFNESSKEYLEDKLYSKVIFFNNPIGIEYQLSKESDLKTITTLQSSLEESKKTLIETLSTIKKDEDQIIDISTIDSISVKKNNEDVS